MSRLVILSLFTLGCCGTWATAQEKYTSEKGKYSVHFPGKPAVSEKEVETPIGKLTMNVATYEVKKDLGFIVVQVDYPEVVKQQKPQEVLERARDGTKGPKDILLDDKEITEPVPGREYVLAKANDSILYRARIFLKDARMYQVIVSGTKKEEVFSPTADKFLNSFEVAK